MFDDGRPWKFPSEKGRALVRCSYKKQRVRAAFVIDAEQRNAKYSYVDVRVAARNFVARPLPFRCNQFYRAFRVFMQAV